VPATDRAVELAVAAATAAADKQASEILALDVSDQLVITDAFVLAAANNPRQVRAVVDAVEEAMSRHGAKLVRREGVTDARWVLLDYSDIVVHVQLAEDRQYYALERLWKDGPEIPLPEEVTGGQVGGQAGGQVPAATS
jgi:ribosome-associated protein